MPIVIPLRLITLIVGGILGYAAGNYIELLYVIDKPYQQTAQFFVGPIGDDSLDSTDEDDYDNLFDECCQSATEYSDDLN